MPMVLRVLYSSSASTVSVHGSDRQHVTHHQSSLAPRPTFSTPTHLQQPNPRPLAQPNHTAAQPTFPNTQVRPLLLGRTEGVAENVSSITHSPDVRLPAQHCWVLGSQRSVLCAANP